MILESRNREYAILRAREETDPRKAIGLLLLALYLTEEPKKTWTQQQRKAMYSEIRGCESKIKQTQITIHENFAKNLDNTILIEAKETLEKRIKELKDQLKNGPR